jgi:hydroxymethylglutaryl-CoA reductase
MVETRVSMPMLSALSSGSGTMSDSARGNHSLLGPPSQPLALLIHAGLGWCGAPDVEKCS